MLAISSFAMKLGWEQCFTLLLHNGQRCYVHEALQCLAGVAEGQDGLTSQAWQQMCLQRFHQFRMISLQLAIHWKGTLRAPANGTRTLSVA